MFFFFEHSACVAPYHCPNLTCIEPGCCVEDTLAALLVVCHMEGPNSRGIVVLQGAEVNIGAPLGSGKVAPLGKNGVPKKHTQSRDGSRDDGYSGLSVSPNHKLGPVRCFMSTSTCQGGRMKKRELPFSVFANTRILKPRKIEQMPALEALLV